MPSLLPASTFRFDSRRPAWLQQNNSSSWDTPSPAAIRHRAFPVASNLSLSIGSSITTSWSAPYRNRLFKMPSRNPTGFDINEFKAAAHPRSVWAKKDPWARHEAWRFTGPFSRWNRFKGLFPGLGTATVLFAGYCVYEHFFIPADHVSHSHGHAGHSHGESHH